MKRVLIVDDEAIMRELVRITLEVTDVRCVEAGGGIDALRLAREQLPDLILLDWMMPDLSGIEVASELGRDPQTAAIPIIMLTAKSQVAERTLAERLPIKAYVVKPFSPRELLRQVEAVLGTQP